jgi:hypothetical protein
MSGIFHSEQWKANGGDLPGWIIGTAGAVRYALPPDSSRAKEARTKVYGFLLGTVHKSGEIDFKFHELNKAETSAEIIERYTPELVNFCFDRNTAFAGPATPARK